MRLSRAQIDWPVEIYRQLENGEEFASDAGGYLSIRTGNYAATHHSLIRRDLITAEYDDYVDPLDAPWKYGLTSKGRILASLLWASEQKGGEG